MSTTACHRCEGEVPDGAQNCPECGVPLHSARPAAFRFTTGEIIDGRYEVVNRIPGGGMGELYKVQHLHLHDVRAIKILRSDQIGDENYRKRFLREARLAASVQHPNVALLHDFATLPDNSWYMVEEFIDGTTLAKSLRSGRRFSLDEIVEIARQVLLGLGAIHDKGIIHRDISPDNIMLANSRAGAIRVKIIDLGIARSMDTSEAHSLTSAGIFVGKPHYASPEQMRLLEDEAPLDHRTDLYSLGVVLYEVVSGKVPFEASTPFDYLMKQLSGDLPQIDREISDKVPPELEAFIVKLLRAKREERFQSTVEALLALSKIRVGKPTLKQDVAIPSTDAPFPLSTPSKKRKQTAEIPIEQLQHLIELDRTGDVRHPVSVEHRRDTPIPDEPATQVDEFDDSQKITIVQTTPVLPTQDVPHPGATPAAGEPPPPESAPPPVVEEDDDSEPVAFVPDIPTIEPPVAPLSHPETTESATARTASGGRTTRQNPIIWFVAGIIFVGVVSVGGYLFYRWLDTRFGSSPESTVAADRGTKAPSTSTADSPIPPDTTSPESVEAGDVETTTNAPDSITSIRVDEPLPSEPPKPREVERQTPQRTEPAKRNESEAPAPTPAPPRPRPAEQSTTPVTKTPPKPQETETVSAEDVAPDGTSVEKSPAANPADAPVVLPGSTDDVREGDLVAPGPGVVNAKVLRTVEPIYPPLSSNMGKQGAAMFSVLVGPDGKVEVVKLIVSSGSEPLDKSAEDAARQTVFSPATKNGVKVRMWKTLRFEFKKTKGY